MSSLITILTVYNGEKLIGSALKSLAWQTRKPDRVIILDDVSSDNTLEVAKSIDGISCECIRNEKNLGYFGNFNKALDYANQTDYLHILHQDDILKPQFYEKLLGAAETAATPTMVYCKARNFEVGQIPPDATTNSPVQPVVRELSSSEFIGHRAELKSFPFCGIVIKTGKQLLRSRFRNDLALHGDMVFWADLAAECRKIIEVDSLLLLNGIHPRTKAPNLKVWIKDDWRAIRMIEEKRDCKGLQAWIRQQKLACKFAARCAIKRKTILQNYPEIAEQIQAEAKSSVGLLRWYLGFLAAKVRGKA